MPDKIARLLAQHKIYKDVQHASFQIENAIAALEDAAVHLGPAMELEVDQLEISDIIGQLRSQKRYVDSLARTNNPSKKRRNK